MLSPTAYGTCKRLTEELGARGVIVLAFDHDGHKSASYGTTAEECRQMARLLDCIADRIERGGFVVWGKL